MLQLILHTCRGMVSMSMVMIRLVSLSMVMIRLLSLSMVMIRLVSLFKVRKCQLSVLHYKLKAR